MARPIDIFDAAHLTSLTDVRTLLHKIRSGQIQYRPSPVSWQDIGPIYFLLVDRFSDGKEKPDSLLTRDQIRLLRQTDRRPDMNWAQWTESGMRWQGGTIKGVMSKLGYLQELGVGAIWLSPIYKQRVNKETYHGYGIQNFLEIDPRFGSSRDLAELIDAAHAKDIKVLLDVIINHSGDNWGYVPPGVALTDEIVKPWYKPWANYYGNPDNVDMKGWRTVWRGAEEQTFTTQKSDLTGAEDGVWPSDLQDFVLYTRAGAGSLSDNDLENPYAEHKRTDFETLKDFELEAGALNFLSDCFKYWIAITDCDGFRIDTVKHLSLEDARNFCGSILEFTEIIGKMNFLLLGEIAGGDQNQDFVMDYTLLMKRNLKAALDIGSDRIVLGNVGKGLEKADSYFAGFNERSTGFASHRTFGDRHVSILDDHDHVFGKKLRFSAEIPDDSGVKDYQIVVPTTLQLFTLGIPCIYYGSEQAFAGPAQNQTQYLENWGRHDGYLRESMFGPEHPRAVYTSDINTQLNTVDTALPGFGAFGTTGKHVFDTTSPSFTRIAALCKVRQDFLVLRTGRQYQRAIRVFGGFALPEQGELIAWSRILDSTEAVCIINPNGSADADRGGDVVVSSELWDTDTAFTVVANTAQVAAERSGNVYIGPYPVSSTVKVFRDNSNGPAYIPIRNIPPCEVLIVIKQY